jgi:hypothetical protein
MAKPASELLAHVGYEAYRESFARNEWADTGQSAIVGKPPPYPEWGAMHEAERRGWLAAAEAIARTSSAREREAASAPHGRCPKCKRPVQAAEPHSCEASGG